MIRYVLQRDERDVITRSYCRYLQLLKISKAKSRRVKFDVLPKHLLKLMIFFPKKKHFYRKIIDTDF